MKRVAIAILMIFSFSFALSLDDVKKSLKSSCINEDSLEMKFKTTITSLAMGSQTVESYSVRKGANKVYFEMKSSLMNQRMILSGDRIKIIDLKTSEERVIKNTPNMQRLMQPPTVNPMEKGNWAEPVFVTDNLYRIEGDSATVYYDNAKKKIVKMEQVTENANLLTTFDYDPSTKQLLSMKISIMIGAQETKVEIFISKYKKSKDFPDRYFNF